MIKKIIWTGLAFVFCCQGQLSSHCQMPCGIYHDDMVFDQIDQYIETMAKGISVLTENKLKSAQNFNEFARWVSLKDRSSDEAANIITTFFLQQKIKPGEDDTVKRLVSAHKLLFYLVAVKQTVDMKVLNDFFEEWERFKLLFHIEGYSCKLEQIKLKKWAEKQKELKAQESHSDKPTDEGVHDHDHDHDHDHPHTH